MRGTPFPASGQTPIEVKLNSRIAESSDIGKGLLAALLVVICWSGFNIVSRFGSTGTFTPFVLLRIEN